jgi:hypothetical protein
MSVANIRRATASILLTCLAVLSIVWTEWTPGPTTNKQKLAARLPLTFEANRGQAAADTKFVAHGTGYALQLTDDGEPVLTLNGRASEPAERAELRLQFLGGNSAPHVQGEQRLTGHSNYLIGNDPGKWLIGVPHFAQVRYHELFPGVDVLYYVKDQQLEYDFIVHPGTDPDSIRVTVKGGQGIERGDHGNLALNTAVGGVVLHKPAAYQQGPDGEQEIACNYVLDDGEVRFALGAYDRSRELRIDPVLSYSTAMDAQLTAIAVDSSGSTYLSGGTNSTNFPTTPGVFQPTYEGGSNGGGDAVVVKLDSTGSTLLFATYLGGSGNDAAGGIALDSSGNIIVAGWTSSANFPVNHAFQSTLLGTQDAFVSKLNANGTLLLYSTYLGGSGPESSTGVALDSTGRVLVTGSTSSANFQTTTGALQSSYGGSGDAFVAKLDTAQSGAASLLFSTYLGGNAEDSASGIAADAGGSAFVTGSTRSANFPAADAFQPACASCAAPEFEFDAFVSKLNANGTALVYSTFLGGHARDFGLGVAVDDVGNAYVAGQTSSLDFPVTTGAFQTSLLGLANAFVAKLNAAGSALMYSSLIGGSDFDVATGIAVDGSGNAYLSGSSSSADYPAVNPLQGYSGGLCDQNGFGDYPCSDAVVTKIDASGSALLASTYLGGPSEDDSGSGIAVDSTGNVYVAGTAGGTFPFTPGTLQTSGTGFAAKVSSLTTGTKPTTITLTSSPNPSDQAQSVTFAATVTPAGPEGQVSFRDGNKVIGFAALDTSGVATFNLGSLSGGNHSIIATYLGDGDFAASTSAPLPHAVNGILLSATQTSASVTRGATANLPLVVSQTGVLASAIAFSCSGLPAGWSCGFSPATVPASSGPTSVTLTVQTSSTIAQNWPRTPLGSPGLPASIWLGTVALLTLGVHLATHRHRVAYVSAPALGLLLLVAGCGSNSNEPPQEILQPVTFGFTVSASSQNATASMPLSITVR